MCARVLAHFGEVLMQRLRLIPPPKPPPMEACLDGLRPLTPTAEWIVQVLLPSVWIVEVLPHSSWDGADSNLFN